MALDMHRTPLGFAPMAEPTEADDAVVDDAVVTAEPDGALPEFTVAVPANWYQLDLDPRTRTGTIAKLVEDRLGATRTPLMRQLRRELTAMLRQYARQAASHGAIYAALMDQVVEGLSLSASLVIAVGEAPRDAADEPVLDPAGLGRVMAGLTDDSDAEVAPRPPAEEFELPAGTAVRLRRTTNSGFAGSDGSTVLTAETQYFVPVPGTGNVLAMTFSTPNLSVRQALEELFDAIARTLDWVRDGPGALP
jgi:hypothetical protein